jgi:alkylation response protein AidB-like acyl-CoA dehydrogenase
MAVVDDTSTTAEEDLVLERIEQLLAEHDPRTTPTHEFLGAQFDAGLAWVHFPEGRGGLGITPRAQKLADERLAAAGASSTAAWTNPIGVGMAAPTVLAHGSEEQQARYLRPCFTGEEVWCQLFSEPGAGSDVAGLASKAVRDGDEWVVNGQKVWTTLAHLARWGLLIARNDPEAPKHKGMTYFVVDMHAPGVEVRPLYQITGEAEFNEVYLTDVHIPDAERLGDVGDGWRVSLTTLMNERVSIGGAIAPKGGGPIAEAVKQYQAHGGDPAQREQLMQLWVEAEVTRLTNIRASQLRAKGTPGPEGAVGKLAFAELNQRITAYTLDLMGAEGMLYGTYEKVRPTHAMSFDNPQKAFLRTRGNSIEGGTSEIMRNILGERVLGLPGEPRTDKELPWIQVPRS